MSDTPNTKRGSIGVVIPTYDHGPLLRESLLSVLAQTRPATEIVVVADGAPIDPAMFIGDLIAQAPVRIVAQLNSGIAAARNFGASFLSTDYVVFHDDDDRLVPTALEHLGALLDSGTCVAAVGGMRFFPKPLRGPEVYYPDVVNDGHYFDLLLDNNCFHASDLLIRCEMFERAGRYRPQIRGIDDYDLWLRLSRLGPIARCPDVTLEYRVHTGSFSAQLTQLDYAPEVARMVSHLVGRGGRSADARVRIYLLKVYLDDVLWGIRADLRAGRWREMVIKIRRALRPLLAPSLSMRVARCWFGIAVKNIRWRPRTNTEPGSGE